MTLQQHIERSAEQCANAAQVSLDVGDPFMPDSFYDILREFATNVIQDADVPKE